MIAGLGHPRVHLRVVGSTNARARELAQAGAPHGTLVTAGEQTAGRGRQGRTWTAPPGRALLMSLVLREWPRLLPLAAAVAVAETIGEAATIKWPNDVLTTGSAGSAPDRKLAGILIEGRPRERWMVVGIGLNVALRLDDLPQELRGRAATLGLGPERVEPTLQRVLSGLQRWLGAGEPEILAAYRARDALAGRELQWSGGTGRAVAIDDDGRLVVELPDGARRTLDSGEVHLGQNLLMEPGSPADKLT